MCMHVRVSQVASLKAVNFHELVVKVGKKYFTFESIIKKCYQIRFCQ